MPDATRPIEVVELRFEQPAPRLSENQARGMGWAQVRRLLEPWQQAVRFAWSARAAKMGRIPNVPCRVEVAIPFKQKVRTDPSNFTGTLVKAMVDALKTAGAWPDDSPEWVQIADPTIVVGTEVVVRLVPRLAESESLGSRAVLRPIEPGNAALCTACRATLTFSAWKEKKLRQQVICNVYVDGSWARVEHFHPPCYIEASEPYGKATA